ncbi:hypothetical protein ACWC4E_09095 [Streptomyces sp. NPDC001273]
MLLAEAAGGRGFGELTAATGCEPVAHDEWEIALGLLEEFGGGRPFPLA